MTISRNKFSAGRFNFVSAGVGGAVNNIWVLGNRGIGKSLSVVAFNKHKMGRINWRVEGNVSDEPYGSLKHGVMLVTNGANVVFKDNTQPIQVGRSMVGLEVEGKTCGAQASGNLLADARSGELMAQSDGQGTAPCPAGTPSGPPALPAGPAFTPAVSATAVGCSVGCGAPATTARAVQLPDAGMTDRSVLVARMRYPVTVLLSMLALVS